VPSSVIFSISNISGFEQRYILSQLRGKRYLEAGLAGHKWSLKSYALGM
jgi:hypothetical protein